MSLKIDYAGIIAKADQRRAALQKLEAQLALAPLFLESAQGVLDYLQVLENVWQSLDKEGRGMLPPAVQNAIMTSRSVFQKSVITDALRPLAAQMPEGV